MEIVHALLSGIGFLDAGCPEELPLLGIDRCWANLAYLHIDAVVQAVDGEERAVCSSERDSGPASQVVDAGVEY